MTDLDGALLFAGVPLAVIAAVFGLVFLTNDKPSREPLVKPVITDRDGPDGLDRS